MNNKIVAMGFGNLSHDSDQDHAAAYLDNLASEEIKFIIAYSAGPLGTPTRAAFITECYPTQILVGLI
ncbi:hypothetical protein [Adhaeribacter pallidiroseus]|uniref:Uncharacterized protein n=1 Tax=Adhaeribacter pallidiroseus TaxID=2072847 RepID=A0A369QLV4_9BACT|nr:hypothetical protein [Adhaeribacter pallidiroseus]RDC64206.1 hypothetical protein AHMF7616_02818 [Adhaeribacter pallidiroseus]